MRGDGGSDDLVYLCIVIIDISGKYYIFSVVLKQALRFRVRKISAHNLFAFDSPNCPPLVEVGLDIEFNKKAVFKPTVIEKCQLHAKMCKNVGLLRIFPSISVDVIKAFCQPPIEGKSIFGILLWYSE